jgi:hypothetical protein
MKKSHLFTSLFSLILVACGGNSNAPKVQVDAKCLAEKDAICRTLELYMEGSRQGDSKITAQAFAPEATLSGIYEGKFMAVPIQVLYDLVDQSGPKESNYEMTMCSVEGSVAIVRIEAQFGQAKYTDMFTMVKDGDNWKIISKVYHHH